MGNIQQSVNWIEEIANDNSHGYQWGGWGPDYDCGHLVIDALEQGGFPVKSHGASYTANMPEALAACGFQDVKDQVNKSTGAGTRAGDVLINRENHAAMVVSGGRIVQARSDYDGMPGDGSGQEIRIQGYYDFPWTHIMRYVGGEAGVPVSAEPAEQATPRTSLRKGDRGDDVKEMQERLISLGYSCGQCGADGIYGSDTMIAVMIFQDDYSLNGTGIADEVTLKTILTANKKETGGGQTNQDGVWLEELQFGSRGDAVKLLQAALNLRGYPCGTVDGIFGKNTEAALNGFKLDRNMETDGKVDVDVWDKLLEVWKK